MKEPLTKVIDMLTQKDFDGAFQTFIRMGTFIDSTRMKL